jgi:glycosyltransferase involved in cell wall biosynthesis
MLSIHGYVDPLPQLGRTDTGGQTLYVLRLAKALSDYGIKVDIFTRWFDRSKASIDPLPGSPEVRIIRIPAGPYRFIPKEKIYGVLPELTENVIEFIRRNNVDYDLFHGHYVDGGIVAIDVAKALGKPTFFTAHSLGAWKRKQMGGNPEKMEERYNFSHRIREELRIFNSVSAQIVQTKIQKNKLIQLYGFRSKNTHVIRSGVDVQTFRPADGRGKRRLAGLPSRYIFCLGRIDPNKGHDLLLNAFDLVRKEIADVHLLIGGGSPRPLQREMKVIENMKRIIEERGMHQKVHIVGYIPDEQLAPYYQNAELFVLPSTYELFGITVLEAMACGTPVVASKYAGIRTVITSGKNGVLVDPTDTEDLAAAMIQILKDKKKAERFGQAGHRLVRRSYTWKAVASKHIKCYEKFLNVQHNL